MRSGVTALWVACAASLFCARRADAADCSGMVSACINDDTLWPHAGTAQFIAVGGIDTVGPKQLGFALVSTYLSRPIVLHLPSPGGPGADAYVINDQVNGTFLWSYGVADRLELDLALPITFGQGGAGLAPVSGGAGLHDTAVRDMRFGFAYAFKPDPRLPGESQGRPRLAARLEVSAPTGDRDQFAGERSAVFSPSLAGAFRSERFFIGAEGGLRLRPTTELLGARVGSQIFGAAGAGIHLLPRGLLSATLEYWELLTLVGQDDVVRESGAYRSVPGQKLLAPAEWLLSIRTEPLGRRDLSIQLGGGGGVWSNVTEPRFRFTLALRWAPGSTGRRSGAYTLTGDPSP
ncbi:MAG TPA: hypothetical protein VGY54_17105 [Polyangiaceae bacterium]|nr:hypothetical protein [Polyangiaceae bacterium]